jgi:hypothetical protein
MEAQHKKEFTDIKVIVFPVVVTYALNILPTSVCRLCTLICQPAANWAVEDLRIGLICVLPDDAYDAESSYADWCHFGSWRRTLPCT